MMEFLILLLLSSGLYRQTHAAAMTAHANRGFGAVGWNGMPVPSRARGAAGRAMPPFAAQCGVTRDSAATVRRAASRQPPAATYYGCRRRGRAARGSCLVAPARSPRRSRASAPSGSLLLHGRAACIVPRCLRVHCSGTGTGTGTCAARRKQARAANAGQDHRCRTRDGVDRRAPARRRAPGSGVLLKRAASGLSRAGPSAPLPPGAAGRGSPRRAA